MRIRQQISRHLIGLLLLALFLAHAGHWLRIDLISRLDAIIYDVRLRLTAPGGVDERIVIIDIDEKSLAEEGRWPWSRDRLAQLVEQVFSQHHARLLAFDVVFAEADRSSGIDTLENLAQNNLRDIPRFQDEMARLRPTLDYDARFAQAIAKRPVVLGYYLGHAEFSSGALPEAVLPAGSLAGHPVAISQWRSYGGNLPQLQRVAHAAGYFNPLVDFDGIFRRVPLLAEYQGEYYESLALAVVRALLDFPPVFPGFTADSDAYAGMEWLDLPGEKITLRLPVDANVAALIPYRGPQGSFPYVSASDVLHGRLPKGALTDRIVLLGTSAPGLVDLRATPFGVTYPGVEAHANLIAGMLDQRLLHKPEYATGVDVLTLCLLGACMIILVPRLSAWRATLFTLTLLASLLGINLTFWLYGQLVMPIAGSMLFVLLLYIADMSWGYFFESHNKRQLTRLFGQYVPPELVEQMSQDPENYSMVGRKAELSVLFSDIRGFTAISETLPPEELTALMNFYLGAMTQVIASTRGTLDKYIGDAVMAFWGAPMADEMHAHHAVQAALNMQTRLDQLNRELQQRGWPALRIGIGINSGWMTVGDMGSPLRQSYTVMGDAVNLASRLEGVCKQYGVNIVLGEACCPLLKDAYLLREIDSVRVKGRQEALRIYEPIILSAEADDATRETLASWHRMLTLYRQQAWDAALVLLNSLEGRIPPGLAQIFSQRLHHYRDKPPAADWDGVSDLSEK
ncbi:CHASE2 domain-containing protein [Azonexus sp.]|uniref:CHASE2 domain-containing protein n=1 Tax=Azonexus sp. TaxID=1872668 RepID=UPI0039E2A954